jgi:hypothetical protein
MTLVVLVLLLEIFKNAYTCQPIVLGYTFANGIQWWTNREMHLKYGRKELCEYDYQWYHAFLYGLRESWPIIPFACIVPIPIVPGIAIGFINILIPGIIWSAKTVAEAHFPNHENPLFLVEQPIIFGIGIIMTVSNICRTWMHRDQVQPMNMSWYFLKHTMEAAIWILAIGVSAMIQYYLNPESHSIFTNIHERSFSSCKMFVAAVKMYYPQYLIVLCQIIVFQDKFDLLVFVGIVIAVPIVIWMASEEKTNNRDNLENRLLWLLNVYSCAFLATFAIVDVLKPVKN